MGPRGEHARARAAATEVPLGAHRHSPRLRFAPPVSAFKVRFALRIGRYAFGAPRQEFGAQQHTAATGAQQPQRDMPLDPTCALRKEWPRRAAAQLMFSDMAARAHRAPGGFRILFAFDFASGGADIAPENHCHGRARKQYGGKKTEIAVWNYQDEAPGSANHRASVGLT